MVTGKVKRDGDIPYLRDFFFRAMLAGELKDRRYSYFFVLLLLTARLPGRLIILDSSFLSRPHGL